MEIYRVAFIGHREIHDGDLDGELDKILAELLEKHEYVEFYVGRNGEFDIRVASAVKRLKKAFGRANSSLILALPYPMKDQKYYEEFYDEVIFPVDTHPKGAITKRNEWLMQNAELLIAYVYKEGGAMTAMQYAEKRGVPVLNLAIENK